MGSQAASHKERLFGASPNKVSSGHPGKRVGQTRAHGGGLFLPKGKRVHAQGYCLAEVLVVLLC